MPDDHQEHGARGRDLPVSSQRRSPRPPRALRRPPTPGRATARNCDPPRGGHDRHGKLRRPGAGGGPVTERPPRATCHPPAAVPHAHDTSAPRDPRSTPARGGEEPPAAPIVSPYGSRTPRHLLRRRSPPRRRSATGAGIHPRLGRSGERPRRMTPASRSSRWQFPPKVSVEALLRYPARPPGPIAPPRRSVPPALGPVAVVTTKPGLRAPRKGPLGIRWESAGVRWDLSRSPYGSHAPDPSGPPAAPTRASPPAHATRVAPCVAPRVPPPVAPRFASPHHVNGPRTRAPTCEKKGTQDRPRNADHFPRKPFRRPARPPLRTHETETASPLAR